MLFEQINCRSFLVQSKHFTWKFDFADKGKVRWHCCIISIYVSDNCPNLTHVKMVIIIGIKWSITKRVIYEFGVLITWWFFQLLPDLILILVQIHVLLFCRSSDVCCVFNYVGVHCFGALFDFCEYCILAALIRCITVRKYVLMLWHGKHLMQFHLRVCSYKSIVKTYTNLCKLRLWNLHKLGLKSYINISLHMYPTSDDLNCWTNSFALVLSTRALAFSVSSSDEKDISIFLQLLIKQLFIFSVVWICAVSNNLNWNTHG